MASDITIYETGTGGDLYLKNNDINLTTGLTNQIYIALFGGNKEENTSENLNVKDNRQDFWGNAYLDSEYQFNSNFERALSTVALTSGGISKLEDAAKSDLKYLRNYADITVVGSIPEIAKFVLDITIKEPDNQSTKVKFIWDGQKVEIIEEITI